MLPVIESLVTQHNALNYLLTNSAEQREQHFFDMQWEDYQKALMAEEGRDLPYHEPA
jgi:hypothetical protein